MPKFWLKRAYVSACLLIAVAIGSYAATIPSAPVLVTPTNGSLSWLTCGIDPGWGLYLEWDTVVNATSYSVEVSTSSAFSSTISNTFGGTLITYSPGLVGEAFGLAVGDTYYWRANASDTSGTSSWSNAWSFTTTVAVPEGPSLRTPNNGALNVPLTDTLIWMGAMSAWESIVQVSTSSAFTNVIVDKTVSLNGEGWVAVNGLLNSTTYYWRANQLFTCEYSSWSSTWSFTTVPPSPGVPLLSSPTNSASNQPTTLTLNWGTVSGAVTYALQLSTDSSFSTTIANQTGLTTGSSIVGGLANNASYYWQVAATNPGGTSSWSNIWSFTTGGASILPVDGKLSKTDFTASNKMISYSLATPGPVEITFSDVLGRTALVVNRKQSVGRYSIELKNCNLASGHYIVSFKAAGVEKQASVVITR